MNGSFVVVERVVPEHVYRLQAAPSLDLIHLDALPASRR